MQKCQPIKDDVSCTRNTYIWQIVVFENDHLGEWGFDMFISVIKSFKTSFQQKINHSCFLHYLTDIKRKKNYPKRL